MREIAAITNSLMQKMAQEQERRYQEGLSKITEVGGVEIFLRTKLPLLSKTDFRITDERVLAANVGCLLSYESDLEDCETCEEGEKCLKDYGVIQEKVDAGKKPVGVTENGEVIKGDCIPWSVKVFKSRMRYAGVPPLYQKCLFNSYKPYTDNQRKALEICKTFVESYKKHRMGDSLLLAGAWGTGKTHLAASICNHLIMAGESDVVFAVTPKMLAQARLSFKDEYQVNPIKKATEARLLILDDVGAEKVTEWVREQLFLLINERYDHELPTVITTNCDIGELENRIGGASVSRIYGMCKGIIVDGEDYRKRR